ncbi:hypothetical protein BVRB_7g168370 [Beta vulgaris subsp. vulgaris]|nr:hypothetical protein BVRB_7g168370 [Beta vulgaris subsp. vulgaris]
MAAKIEHGKPEVSMKLEEIKSFVYKGRSKMNLEIDIPKDLELGISSSNKQIKQYMNNKDSFEKDNEKGNEVLRRTMRKGMTIRRV